MSDVVRCHWLAPRDFVYPADIIDSCMTNPAGPITESMDLGVQGSKSDFDSTLATRPGIKQVKQHYLLEGADMKNNAKITF